eukprot:scaffold1159_cov215-Pinguiococcus_pyrenoidosus.AAC.15
MFSGGAHILLLARARDDCCGPLRPRKVQSISRFACTAARAFCLTGETDGQSAPNPRWTSSIDSCKFGFGCIGLKWRGARSPPLSIELGPKGRAGAAETLASSATDSESLYASAIMELASASTLPVGLRGDLSANARYLAASLSSLVRANVNVMVRADLDLLMVSQSAFASISSVDDVSYSRSWAAATLRRKLSAWYRLRPERAISTRTCLQHWTSSLVGSFLPRQHKLPNGRLAVQCLPLYRRAEILLEHALAACRPRRYPSELRRSRAMLLIEALAEPQQFVRGGEVAVLGARGHARDAQPRKDLVAVRVKAKLRSHLGQHLRDAFCGLPVSPARECHCAPRPLASTKPRRSQSAEEGSPELCSAVVGRRRAVRHLVAYQKLLHPGHAGGVDGLAGEHALQNEPQQMGREAVDAGDGHVHGFAAHATQAELPLGSVEDIVLRWAVQDKPVLIRR